MGKHVSLILIICTMLILGVSASSAAHQVAVVKSADIGPYNEAVEGFKKNCSCSIRELSLSESGDVPLRQQIREQQPELIMTIGVDALTEVSRITDLPVVYAMVPNSQLPGMKARNVSGVNLYVAPEKYLNAILDLFPKTKRIGIVFDPKNLDAFVKEAEQVAQKKGVELVLRKVTRANDVPAAIDMIHNRVDVFWMLPDVTVVNSESFKYLLGVSYQHNVPVFTFTKKYVEMGAAAGLYVVPADIGAQAAEIAKRILTDNTLKSPLRVDARGAALIVNDRIIRKLGAAGNEDAVRRAGHVQ
ncbi:MAG: ABC transporter substrate binding protein [Thermodesulfovibrionales bacterium]